ncbi:MAG: type IV pilus modification PilV family protein [Planctomycetota bacterium]|jgi:hypothetical protein
MAGLNKNRGFSLTEVLLSVGTLAIGMIFIAGVFPVGIHFTTVATEQTIAAVVADEAFAKIRIYAVGDLDNIPTNDNYDPSEWSPDVKNAEALADFNNTGVFDALKDVRDNIFLYPSEPSIDNSQKKYFWSALCRLTEKYNAALNPNPPVQVTVFVCRKVNPNLQYPDPAGIGVINWPRPVPVAVSQTAGDNELEIDSSAQETYINDGCRIVDDRTGRLYRVLKRYPYPNDDTILLDRDWDDEDWDGGPSPAQKVWVVPPPLVPGTSNSVSGRNPCIAIYQKVIRF